MNYIYLKELYPNQNLINGFENLNCNKNIFYGSESLKDTISRIYQAIMKFIHKIWNWIKEQFRKLKSILNLNKKKIEETEVKIKENKEILKNENNSNTQNSSTTDTQNPSTNDVALSGLINRIIGHLENKVYPITIDEFFRISTTYSDLFSKKLDDVIESCLRKNITNDNSSLFTYLVIDHVIRFNHYTDEAKEILNGSIKNVPKIPLIYVLSKDIEEASFDSKKYIKEKFNIENKDHYDNLEELLVSLDKLLKFIKNINNEIEKTIYSQNISFQPIQKINQENVYRVLEKNNNVINKNSSLPQKVVTDINNFILTYQELNRYFFAIIEISLDKIINDINYIVTEIPKITKK